MSEESVQVAEARRRRVQRLKRYIIILRVTFLLMPVILCAVLLVQVNRMGRTMEELSRQMENLTTVISEQQREQNITGQGSAQQSEGERELIGQELVGQKTDQDPAGQDSDGQQEGNEPEGESTDSASETEKPAGRKVYLTFDDGPSRYTEEILDILDQYEVKATFFVVGKESDWAREALQEIVDRGHTLGMHSYSHKYAEIYESVESFSEDLDKIQNYVYDATGVTSTVYRFPGGSSNTISKVDMNDFADYLDTREIRFFDWNVSSGDAVKGGASVEQLTKNVMGDVVRHKNVIVLMHDAANKRTTVEALPIIIENILALEDTEILPITDETEPVQHIR